MGGSGGQEDGKWSGWTRARSVGGWVEGEGEEGGWLGRTSARRVAGWLAGQVQGEGQGSVWHFFCSGAKSTGSAAAARHCWVQRTQTIPEAVQVHMHAHKRICTLTLSLTRSHTHTHIRTRMHACMHAHMCMHTHAHTCACVCAGKVAPSFPQSVVALGQKCPHLCTAIKLALAAGHTVLASLQVCVYVHVWGG